MEQVDQDVYQLIGEATVVSQLFEKAFVMCAKLALQQSDAETLEEVAPISLSKSLKQPVSALLKELKSSRDVPFESRVLALIDSRHRIIHRLTSEHEWPQKSDENTKSEIKSLCNFVIEESKSLTLEFTDLLRDWAIERGMKISI